MNKTKVAALVACMCMAFPVAAQWQQCDPTIMDCVWPPPPPPPPRTALFSEGHSVDSALAVDEDGDVWVWGFRGSGQHGNGNQPYGKTKVPVLHHDSDDPPEKVGFFTQSYVDDNGVTRKRFAVAAQSSDYAMFALTDEGRLYGWGHNNAHKETGCPQGSPEYTSYHKAGNYIVVPCEIFPTKRIAQFGVGTYSGVALTTDGEIWAWGAGNYGQIGNGEKKTANPPTRVHLSADGSPNTTDTVVLIGSGYESHYAVTEYTDAYGVVKRRVWGWGDNDGCNILSRDKNGAREGYPKPSGTYVLRPRHIVELDDYADQIVKIRGVADAAFALLNDGRLIGWGSEYMFGVAGHTGADYALVTTCRQPGNSYYKDRATTGFVHTLKTYASLADAKTNTGPDRFFTDFHAKTYTLAAITVEGSLVTFGSNESAYYASVQSPIAQERWTDTGFPIVAIGGNKHTVYYQTSDGTAVYGVGYNPQGQINPAAKNPKAPSVRWTPIPWPGVLAVDINPLYP
jgi:alpha-tubulin suppressor-like RCC1 family protein